MPPKKKKKTKRKRLYVGRFGPVQPKGPDTSMSTLAAVMSLLAAKPPIPPPPSGGPQHFVMPPTHRAMERSVGSDHGSLFSRDSGGDSMHGSFESGSERGSEHSSIYGSFDKPIQLPTPPPTPAARENEFDAPPNLAPPEDDRSGHRYRPGTIGLEEVMKYMPTDDERRTRKLQGLPSIPGRGNKLTKPRYESIVKLYETADDDTKVQLYDLVTTNLANIKAGDAKSNDIAIVDGLIAALNLVPGSTRDDPSLNESTDATLHQSIGNDTMHYSIDPSGVDASIVRRFQDAGAAVDAFITQGAAMPMSPIQPPGEGDRFGGGGVLSPGFEESMSSSVFSPNPIVRE